MTTSLNFRCLTTVLVAGDVKVNVNMDVMMHSRNSRPRNWRICLKSLDIIDLSVLK